MPLHILLPLVVFGIAGITLLLHLLGKSEKLRFETEADAIHHWLRQFPYTDVRRVILAQSGHAALIFTAKSKGMVWAFGADSVARYVKTASFTETPKGLMVRFPKFEVPSALIDLTPDEQTLWLNTLKEAT